MNVPKLRFKEFTDEWQKVKISSFVNESKRKTGDIKKYPLWSLTIENGVTPKTDRYERSFLVKKEDNYKIVYPNYYVYNPMNAHLGAIARNKSDKSISVSGYYDIFSINNDYYGFYDNYFISPVMFKKYKLISSGSLLEKQRVHYSQFKELKIYLPSDKEQEKIAKLLSLLDKKIALQTKKIETLKLFKSCTKSKIFKDGNHACKLGAILNKWNKKNKDGAINYVESISNKAGFIPQSEQFEDRNVASKNLRNYYVIKKGVFGYNPSRLNVGSLALKENDSISVVSPLYECFTTTQNNTYLFEWFNSDYFKKETSSRFEGGVRNTLNFNNLCDIPINLPDIETQNKYAKYFNKLNFKISLEEQKLSKLLKYKKALLQDMFI